LSCIYSTINKRKNKYADLSLRLFFRHIERIEQRTHARNFGKNESKRFFYRLGSIFIEFIPVRNDFTVRFFRIFLKRFNRLAQLFQIITACSQYGCGLSIDYVDIAYHFQTQTVRYQFLLYYMIYFISILARRTDLCIKFFNFKLYVIELVIQIKNVFYPFGADGFPFIVSISMNEVSCFIDSDL
jgi:hypothetical protein